MKKSELINFLNQRYNFSNQEEWDNCGVSPQSFCDEEISKVFISLDMNWDAYHKAINQGCNVIISHHPIMIDEQQELINENKKLLINAMQNKQVINIALHTCFDRDKFGTSYLVTKTITNSLSIDKMVNLSHNPYLLIIYLTDSMTVKDLIGLLNVKSLRYLNVQTKQIIKTICIGAGSCSGMLEDVIANKIDCFLTGDIKWHGYLDGLDNNVVMIDINHSIERVFIDAIYDLLARNLPELQMAKDYSLIEIINK